MLPPASLPLALGPNPLSWPSGPFLGLYLVLLLLLAVWCARRRRAFMASFELREPPPVPLDDPYEVAWLAGGVPRVTALAVFRLVAAGAIEWRSKFTGARLIQRGTQDAAALHPIELAVARAVRERGNKGLPPEQLGPLVAAAARPLEIRLASLGLRPTCDERTRAGLGLVWPLLLLLGGGLLRLGIGLSNARPVGFLLLCLVLTVVLAVGIGRPARHLTAAGLEILNQRRERHRHLRRLGGAPSEERLAECSLGLALFGPTALSSLTGYERLAKDLGKQATAGGGGDVSTSTSGCSSGCGGSGCGGCGGGD